MKLEKTKPIFSIKKGDDLSLSGEVFLKLLEAVIDKRAAFRFKAKGFSMSPFIKDGDIVTVSPLFGVPALGDVVAIIHPETEKLIVHRIIGKRKDFYLIKGDNVCEIDGFIPDKNIIGRVTRIERSGKRIFLGFGPERFLIALLSRKKLLLPLLSSARMFLRPIVRRSSI